MVSGYFIGICSRWNENVNMAVFDADGVGLDAIVVAAQAGAVLE